MSDLRKPFIDKLIELSRDDDSIMLIVGDVGYGFAEPFINEFPNRFINVGIIEQSMIGIAVGLAKVGLKPYVYSVINFVLFRPYEQVRNDVAYGNTNVKILGVRGEESYKFLGHSHNIDNDEDVRILAHLPNIKVCIPQHPIQLKEYVQKTYEDKCPAYIRL